MSYMRLTHFLWAVIWCGTTAYAGGPGTTAGNFLQLGIGPRATAMGDAQVGLADDVYATAWNPAGLAQLEVQEAGFVQHQYVENISQQYVAYAYPHSALGTFAGSLNYLGVGSFKGYDATGLPRGEVSANDLAVGFSYARTYFRDRRLGSGVSFGATGTYLRERLSDVSAQTVAGDLGALWSPGKRFGEFLEGWRLGGVVRNIGGKLRYDREAFPIPRSFEAGLSYAGRWRDELITLSLDGRQPSGADRSLGLGLEVRTLQYFLIRTGYTSAGDLGSGWRMGGGIRFKTLQVDYAYAGAGEFGGTHRVGLTCRFGKPPEDLQYVAQRWYEKGLRNFRRRRYTEALVEFNKALEIDPAHPDALKMMKTTYEEIKVIVPE